MMKPGLTFLLGLLLGALAIPALGYLYLKGGNAPVATAAAPFPFEASLAHMALSARVDAEAPKTAALPVNDANLIDGAKEYRTHCAVCHGLIDQPQTAISKGMFPKPPLLFKHGVTDDPVGETYWKVENGIRLSGMPGYKGSLSEDSIWKMSLMLANADKLPAAATEILRQP